MRHKFRKIIVLLGQDKILHRNRLCSLCSLNVMQAVLFYSMPQICLWIEQLWLCLLSSKKVRQCVMMENFTS